MSFFGTSPRAPARGRVLKNSRFEPAVRILLFAAESKKLVQKGSFLRSIIASKTPVFETPWRKKKFERCSSETSFLRPFPTISIVISYIFTSLGRTHIYHQHCQKKTIYKNIKMSIASVGTGGDGNKMVCDSKYISMNAFDCGLVFS